MRHTFALCTLIIVLLFALPSSKLRAWHHEGHHLTAAKAVRALPESVPAFFREGAMTVAHMSIDPDMMRNPAAPHLRQTIGPEHFIDLELLEGRQLPGARWQYVDMLYELKVAPQRAGYLPYAITEWTEALTIAFAEHRKWPDNPHIRSKCLVYAGYLAHYAADLQQPLHTTLDYDGRSVEGKSPRSGIHAKVDDLLYRFQASDITLEASSLRSVDDVFAAVVAELAESHKLVDAVYALEPLLPGVKEAKPIDDRVRAFALERAAASARFTALLMLTAWEKSAAVELPPYIDRAEQDGGAP